MITGESWALQKGVFQTLAADADLLALLGAARIYDDVPEDATFPFLTIGEVTERDNGTFTETATEHTFTIHAWSRAGGRKEVKDMAHLTIAALNDALIALEDHRLVNLRFETSRALRDPDGRTYHAIVQFRAVTEPAP